MQYVKALRKYRRLMRASSEASCNADDWFELDNDISESYDMLSCILFEEAKDLLDELKGCARDSYYTYVKLYLAQRITGIYAVNLTMGGRKWLR